MTHSDKLTREDALTQAIRAATQVVDAAVGRGEVASQQALDIIEAIKRLRSDRPARIPTGSGVDYLHKVQQLARALWCRDNQSSQDGIGPKFEASATFATPIGKLTCVTWRRAWNGKQGERSAWASEYYLDGQPITVTEIRAAGLAQRPTRRKRKADQ